jgi:deoxycytidine triphosphate deaminase
LNELADQLRSGLLDRARAFGDQVEHELAQIGSTGPGMRQALKLFRAYAEALREQVDVSWADSMSDAQRVGNMRGLSLHLRERVRLFDQRFRRGHLYVPQAMTSAIERACADVGLPGRQAVITVGPPLNFATFGAELQEYLFRLMDVDIANNATKDAPELVLIAIPELEGVRAAWQPLTLGHELGHYLLNRATAPSSFAIASKLDKSRIAAFSDPLPSKVSTAEKQTRAFEQLAARWLREVQCDAFGVHRFGAASVAAMADFSEFVGGTGESGPDHPPSAFRLLLMQSWMRHYGGVLDDEIVGALAEIASFPTAPDWAEYLCGVLRDLAPTIWADIDTLVKITPYGTAGREEVIEAVAEQLESGVPGLETVEVANQPIDVQAADVLNATWLSIQRGSTKPINRLATKALDTLDFLQRWRSVDAQGDPPERGQMSLAAGPGVLVEPELLRRLASRQADRVGLTPLLPGGVGGASVDLRLGNKFVVFERSNAAAFDALDEDQDPASMQRFVEKSWGDVFFLHPGQLVLAATLEYLTIPGDLTAQVITRSSYGRLGLLSATAVQVHPHFAGCLTLELVNLGEMPMVLTPGERIAQLVLSTTAGTVPRPTRPAKYQYPTGPEFSKIRRDRESDILRKLRVDFNPKPNLSADSA